MTGYWIHKTVKGHRLHQRRGRPRLYQRHSLERWEELRREVAALRNQGMSHPKIAAELDVSLSFVVRTLAKARGLAC